MANKVEIRYIEKTSLNEASYLKLVRRFKKIKHNLVIVFDRRIKSFGTHIYDSKKRTHIIRISPKVNSNQDKGVEKYHLLSTTLHELHHAQQKENKGAEYWSKKYRQAIDVENSFYSDYFSECELEARAYEHQNTAKAIELYNRYLLQNPS
jgi:hypothetical protein